MKLATIDLSLTETSSGIEKKVISLQYINNVQYTQILINTDQD